MVEVICSALDDLLTGHDRRYAIDPTLISNELGWYLEQQGGYSGGRLERR